jgi:hypothetical protein
VPQEDEDIVLGYKRITTANITSPDVSRFFGNLGEARWIELFNEPQLVDLVPEHVRGMFEHARGAMIYGWYYYPLLTVGYAECARTIEAGARNASMLLWPDRTPKRYAEMIKDLHGGGWIGDSDADRWQLGRQIRNSFAHPSGPTILPPGQASAKLRGCAEQLNALFTTIAARPS